MVVLIKFYFTNIYLKWEIFNIWFITLKIFKIYIFLIFINQNLGKNNFK